MKKILVFSGYRSDYTKLKSVLFRMKESKKIEMIIVLFGAHTLEECGDSYKNLSDDGFNPKYILNTNVSGIGTDPMVKSIGVGIMEISTILNLEKPDASMIVGDRYEILSSAIASSINNIPVIHIQGGELSGTIDEVIRHSITKLSHLHFPSTEKSANRIIQMGESKENVYNVGCPALDYILDQNYCSKEQMANHSGFNQFSIDYNNDYGILIQHAVTTEHEDSHRQMLVTLNALQKFKKQILLVYPNPDAGSDGIIKAIRNFDLIHKKHSVIKEKVKNLPFNIFLNLLKNSSFIIGNSSSGIRESHIFNIPTINIGSRQNNRERTSNIIDVSYDEDEILNALRSTAKIKKNINNPYGDGTAGKKICDIIEKTDFTKIIIKKFNDYE
jgi:UDP-N-acetylglucosamine 2-epimerase (non-hydrolysing)/GDP/UDP-N,N'-diacetylbacillosamine 2-epimerase (hydrolysing)